MKTKILRSIPKLRTIPALRWPEDVGSRVVSARDAQYLWDVERSPRFASAIADGFLTIKEKRGGDVSVGNGTLSNLWWKYCTQVGWPYIRVKVQPVDGSIEGGWFSLTWDWLAAEERCDRVRDHESFDDMLILLVNAAEYAMNPEELTRLCPPRHRRFYSGGAYIGTAYGSSGWLAPIKMSLYMLNEMANVYVPQIMLPS